MGSMEDEEVALPGFRFYPTDEELVGFYLRRKVDKKPTPIQLIKQIDIYKYDPWDLPKLVGSVGDNCKEWYFFCKRGRKYRNSIRPNRVTGSGFWKATGIDKPIYSAHGDQTTTTTRDCVGLKKSLVYYRGSAGKGTKTDWMMHEFRLPPDPKTTSNLLNIPKSGAQEAEVWTLCRIFKRNVSYTKYTPNWREVMGKRDSRDTSSKTCNMEFENQESLISFEAPVVCENDNKKPINGHISERNQLFVEHYSSSTITHQPPFMATSSTVLSPDVHDFFIYENWDEFKSGVEFAIDPFPP